MADQTTSTTLPQTQSNASSSSSKDENLKYKLALVGSSIHDVAGLLSSILTANSQSEIENIKLQISQVNATSAERLQLLQAAADRQKKLAASEAENSKTSRTILIISGVVSSLAVLGFFMFLITKEKTKAVAPVANPTGLKGKRKRWLTL